MQGNGGLKKWAITGTAACLLSLGAAPVHLFAEEPAPAVQGRPLPERPGKEDRTGEGMITRDETLTLGRCIDIALRKNPAAVAAVNTVEVNRSRMGEARSNYYPQLNASGAYNRISPVQGTTAALTAPRYDQYTASATLNLNILDFGKTSSQVDIQKFNLDASRSDLIATQDAIILNVKQAYYGVLQAERTRDVAADVVKQFQQHLDQAKGFYEVGTKAKIDVTRAEVDLSNAKLSLIRAENALRISWVVLNNAMGVPDAPEYTIEDNLSFQKYAITLEEATARAFENRPDLKALIARREAADEGITLARKGYFPALDGSASYNRAGQDFPLEDGWSAGVVLTVPLFSGFLTSHQVAEAKSALYVVRANEESLRQQILLDVRQAYLNLHQAEESIATAELAVRQAQENLDLANGRYAAGVGSPIEVTDAFAIYVNAQATYTGSLYNYRIAQADIERAMGAR